MTDRVRINGILRRLATEPIPERKTGQLWCGHDPGDAIEVEPGVWICERCSEGEP